MSRPEKASHATSAFEKAAKPASTKRGRHGVARPFSIRLSEDERQILAREAGKLSLAAYVRHKLLGAAVSPRRSKELSRKPQRPKGHQLALGKVLALLGQSELFRSLDHLAKSAKEGALPVTPELLQELRTACDHVRDMRTALMGALRTKADANHDTGR